MIGIVDTFVLSRLQIVSLWSRSGTVFHINTDRSVISMLLSLKSYKRVSDVMFKNTALPQLATSATALKAFDDV